MAELSHDKPIGIIAITAFGFDKITFDNRRAKMTQWSKGDENQIDPEEPTNQILYDSDHIDHQRLGIAKIDDQTSCQ